MGTVFQVEHTRPRRLVALKVIRRTQSADPRARFDLELRAAGRLDHLNLVRATDASGISFLVMD